MRFAAETWLLLLLGLPLLVALLRLSDGWGRSRLAALLGERASEYVEHENRRVYLIPFFPGKKFCFHS